uniref:Fibroblast growth factor n=1 Tax=Strigamia maritima TaxID=126957 RepID=T1IQI1_STRMM
MADYNLSDVVRFFQFAVVAYLLCLHMVSTRPDPESISHIIPDEMPHSQMPVLRRYSLYNRCSGQHLQIPGKNVFAGSGPFAELLVRDFGFNSTIKIQGYKSKAYLCFTKRGKLKARFHFVPDNCVFEEKMDDNMYTALWLRRKNKLWKVGFNKKGRPLAGDSYNKRIDPTCFQFMKRPPMDISSTASNDALEKLYQRSSQQQLQKHRHRHRHRLRHHLNGELKPPR